MDDKVKRPERPPARNWGPEDPSTSSYYIRLSCQGRSLSAPSSVFTLWTSAGRGYDAVVSQVCKLLWWLFPLAWGFLLGTNYSPFCRNHLAWCVRLMLQATASTKDKFNTLWGFLHPCHASPHPLSGPPSSLPPFPLIPSQPSGDIYCPRYIL